MTPNFLFNPVYVCENFCIDSERVFKATQNVSITGYSDQNKHTFVLSQKDLNWTYKTVNLIIIFDELDLCYRPPESPCTHEKENKMKDVLKI